MEFLAAGRDADVYLLDAHRVLRRYREVPVQDQEVRAMRHVAEHGYPVPRVHDVSGRDMVLQRLRGPTMMDLMMTSGSAGHGRTLADLHNRLHRISAPGWLGDGPSILHMDLHPANVVMTDDGPVVIDWRNVEAGEAALDVADLCILLRAVTPPGVNETVLAEWREDLVNEFLAHVDHDPTDHIRQAVDRRSRDTGLSDTQKQAILGLITDAG